MISMLITLVAGFLVLATTSVVALLVMASGGFSAGGAHQRRVKCTTVRAVTAATRVGAWPGQRRNHEPAILRLRLAPWPDHRGGFLRPLRLRDGTAHAWGPMVVFLIPAGLASYAASRLLLLKLGVVFWH